MLQEEVVRNKAKEGQLENLLLEIFQTWRVASMIA
jgi:hypothetical protein